MANAKKCDICGKLYEIPIRIDAARINIDFGCAGDRYIDLCDECYDKLREFIAPAIPKDFSVERRQRIIK